MPAMSRTCCPGDEGTARCLKSGNETLANAARRDMIGRLIKLYLWPHETVHGPHATAWRLCIHHIYHHPSGKSLRAETHRSSAENLFGNIESRWNHFSQSRRNTSDNWKQCPRIISPIDGQFLLQPCRNLRSPRRRDAVGWAFHPRAHREPPLCLCARFIYSRGHPHLRPTLHRSRSATPLHYCSSSPQNALRFHNTLIFLTQIAHFVFDLRTSRHTFKMRASSVGALFALAVGAAAQTPIPYVSSNSYCRTRHSGFTPSPRKM